jgi:hypothetical protein
MNKPKNLTELDNLISDTIKKDGPSADLNFIDISEIKNLTQLFKGSEFNGDISQWDTSNVERRIGCSISPSLMEIYQCGT